MVMDVLDRAMQVHGALGVSDDTPLAVDVAPGPRMLRLADGPGRGAQDGDRPARAEPLQAARTRGGLVDGRSDRPDSVGADRRAAGLRRGDPRLRARRREARRAAERRPPLRRDRRARWPSSAGGACRSTRSTAARAARSSTPRCSSRRPRAARCPIGAYGVTLIVVGALNRFGTEEQKQELLGARGQGRRAGDRDVRARGRLGRGVAEDQGPARGRRVGAERRRRCGARTPTRPATR